MLIKLHRFTMKSIGTQALLGAWYFLSIPFLSAQAQAPDLDERMLRGMIIDYMDRYTDPYNSHDMQQRLRPYFQQYPKQAVALIDERLSKYNKIDDASYGHIQRGIFLLHLIPRDAAIPEYDKLYRRFNGTSPDHVTLRSWIISSFRLNLWTLHNNNIVLPLSQQELRPLENWLQSEVADDVLRQGIRVLSSYGTELSPDIVKRVRETKTLKRDLSQALRKTKINGLKDYPAVVRDVLQWMDDIILEAEKIRVACWDKNSEEITKYLDADAAANRHLTDDELQLFFGRSLKRDPKGLAAVTEQLKHKVKQLDQKLAELGKQIQEEKNVIRKELLTMERVYPDRMRRTLLWVLESK